MKASYNAIILKSYNSMKYSCFTITSNCESFFLLRFYSNWHTILIETSDSYKHILLNSNKLVKALINIQLFHLYFFLNENQSILLVMSKENMRNIFKYNKSKRKKTVLCEIAGKKPCNQICLYYNDLNDKFKSLFQYEKFDKHLYEGQCSSTIA